VAVAAMPIAVRGCDPIHRRHAEIGGHGVASTGPTSVDGPDWLRSHANDVPAIGPRARNKDRVPFRDLKRLGLEAIARPRRSRRLHRTVERGLAGDQDHRSRSPIVIGGVAGAVAVVALLPMNPARMQDAHGHFDSRSFHAYQIHGDTGRIHGDTGRR
jgi:hypothetical protein